MATISSELRGSRIATLDIVRGIAVMGILAMNIIAFAMPEQATFNPLAYGAQRTIDFVAYAFTFIFVEGKMRGLFTFLFGASMLLVIQLAQAKGESAAKVTFSRQFWLLVFGLIHFYLIWWGDILILYALVGMLAWFFRGKTAKSLMRWGIGLVTLQFLILLVGAVGIMAMASAAAVPNPDPELVKAWRAATELIAIPSTEMLRADLATYRGDWLGIVQHTITDKLWWPLIFAGAMGAETLGYMLLGMAALKSGFLTGEWADSRYRKTVLVSLSIALPATALLLAWMFATNFGVVTLSSVSAATVVVRPMMVVAYAGLIILATRRGGWLVDRIAAAGRVAFTNYLGTSLLLTALFYGWGLGLYGSVGRFELYLLAVAAWVVMLAWSKPWLDRFAYGPLEWTWRSLARGRPQPMRKLAGADSSAAGA